MVQKESFKSNLILGFSSPLIRVQKELFKSNLMLEFSFPLTMHWTIGLPVC